MTIEFIISRYNEDLSWTIEPIFNEYKYIIYNKSDNENFVKTNIKEIITLPNVGRCDHTYLYHVVSNYNNLSDIIVFLPGSLNMPQKKNKAIDIITRIKKNGYQTAIFSGHYVKNIHKYFYNFNLNEWKCSFKQNYIKNSENKLTLSQIRPFGKWYEYFFQNRDTHTPIFTFGGVFSIDKRDILQNNIEWYILFLEQLSTSSNPEVGHYIERSWCSIFGPIKNTRVLLYPLPK